MVRPCWQPAPCLRRTGAARSLATLYILPDLNYIGHVFNTLCSLPTLNYIQCTILNNIVYPNFIPFTHSHSSRSCDMMYNSNSIEWYINVKFYFIYSHCIIIHIYYTPLIWNWDPIWICMHGCCHSFLAVHIYCM